MAFLDRLARVLARIGYPAPDIPQHHRAAAVFALGDGAFECAVVERVILGPHRQAVLAGVEARAFRHRPALEHSVELQPEIPVQPGRLMLLDDEAVALALELAPLGLLRLGEVALAIIGRDVERQALGHGYARLRAGALAGSFFALLFFAEDFVAVVFLAVPPSAF